MDIDELWNFLEQLELLKDDLSVSYAVMSDELKERGVNVAQIEGTIIDITGYHPAQLDQAGVRGMVNAINANWDTMSGITHNNAQRGTALAILRQAYQLYFRGLYGHRRG